MSLEAFVTTYGYFALFVGTIIEGETIVLIAGFLAHRGYLHLTLVMLVAFLGSLCGDLVSRHISCGLCIRTGD